MVEIKKTDGSAKSLMDEKLVKKRAEKRKQLETQLSKTTAKINGIKNKKPQ